MGKKKRGKKKVSSSGKPFVSVCTPTYNRRRFLPFLIKCFQAQTYPKELMEWNLPSEPWIFVVDSNGKVFEKFEGLISENELETSIQRVAELY